MATLNSESLKLCCTNTASVFSLRWNIGIAGLIFRNKALFYSLLSAGIGCAAYVACKRWHKSAGRNPTKSTICNDYCEHKMGQQHNSYAKTSTSEFCPDDSCEVRKEVPQRSNYSKIPSSDLGTICKDESSHGVNLSDIIQEPNLTAESDTGKGSFYFPNRAATRTENDSTRPRLETTDNIVIRTQPQKLGVNGFSSAQYQKKLLDTLNSLYGSNKLLSEEEAKNLAALLQQRDEETLLKVVTTMCNLAAFTINQNLFRNNGAVDQLIRLLMDDSISSCVNLMIIQCIGNMSVNAQNHTLLQVTVPHIIKSFVRVDCSELQKIISIQTLTNLSAEISPLTELNYVPVIQPILNRLWSADGPNLASLRLLVNLSFVPSLAANILKSKAPTNFVDLLRPDLTVELLIRSATFFGHLFSNRTEHVAELNALVASASDLKTIYEILFVDVESKQKLRTYIEVLNANSNEELREKARRLNIDC